VLYERCSYSLTAATTPEMGGPMHNFMILCAASDTTGSIAAAGIITEVSPRGSF
jgi:hypothetical protein